MQHLQNLKLAVLIDADNAQACIAQEVLAELSTHGVASVKRAYGDWTTPNLKGWKDNLHKMAIQPMQQFSYTPGKNSSDSALIIDAMDLLHGGGLDGFCIVSSDSDFTRLATRIREAGLVVFGFGEAKTPVSFVAACDKFTYTEVLRPQPEKTVKTSRPVDDVAEMLKKAISATAGEDGFAALCVVGGFISKLNPAFDARHFGCKTLGALAKKQNFLEVKEVPMGKSAKTTLVVRVK